VKLYPCTRIDVSAVDLANNNTRAILAGREAGREGGLIGRICRNDCTASATGSMLF
jgi:hypothetical protein